MLYNKEDLAWAAGLFEGEGCFTVRTTGRPSPAAQVCSTDKDVVKRFKRIMGFGSIHPYIKNGGKNKTVWVWSASRFETFQATIALFWKRLSKRRKARAKEILKFMKEYHAAGKLRGILKSDKRSVK